MPTSTKKQRKKAILCNYGTGGHAEQMRRLLSHIDTDGLELIAQSPVQPSDRRFGEYSNIAKVRQEYATLGGVLAIPFYALVSVISTWKLFRRCDIRVVISTGPGVAILPSIIGKLLGAKAIYFESWSRFTSPSLAGLIMYRIADVFFVQNEEMRPFYERALYMGRL